MRTAILPPAESATQQQSALESRIQLLAQGLLSRGIDVTIFGTSCDSEQWNGVPARMIEIPGSLSPDLRSHWRMSHFLEISREFDLIHSYGDHLPVVYSGLLPTPVLTTIHELPSEEVLPIYLKSNDRTFYVSTSQAARPTGLKYLATVYPGISVDNFEFQEASGEYLVFAGDIKPGAGLEEATAMAKASGRGLIIAGTVQDRHFVVELSDSGQVESKSRVDYDGLKLLLKNAYCLVNPSCDITLLEANAYGTPVISFPRGSIPEFISNGVNGFLVSDISEAVEAIQNIKGLSRRLCREFVQERFSADRMVDEYLDVYSHILHKTKREDVRPWGCYEVLSDRSDHKVKRITIHAGKRLSLQRHNHRSEHWVIVSGKALVTLNSSDLRLEPGQSVDIPLGAVHRIYNPGSEPLEFVEVQMGEYFGEDDIERLEDDFERA